MVKSKTKNKKTVIFYSGPGGGEWKSVKKMMEGMHLMVSYHDVQKYQKKVFQWMIKQKQK